MKNLKYILIITIAMFVGMNGVSAKTVEKTCLYQAFGTTNPDVGLEGDIAVDGDNEVTVYIYDNGSANAKITVAKGFKKNQTVSVANWKAVKDSYNGNCFGYILLEYDWSNSVYVSNSKTELENIVTSKNFKLGDNAFIIAGSERDVSQEEQNAAYIYIENATKEIESIDFNVANCRNGDDLSKCESIYDSANKMLGDHHSKVLNYGASGIVSLQDEVVQKFLKAHENAVANLGKFNQDIKDTQKEIDIKNQEDDDDNEGVIVDPNYRYGCGIFGDTIIGVIKEIYGHLKWIIPVIIVTLSMVDFVKVVGTGKDDDFKKAQNNLIKRIIIGVAFFLVPTLITAIIRLSGITEQFTDGDSIISAITCILG